MAMAGAYPQGAMFMPPWGLPHGFADSQAAQLAARNQMPFMYPSYLSSQGNSSGQPIMAPPQHIVDTGNASTPPTEAPMYPTATAGQTLSSGCSTSPASVPSMSSTSGSAVASNIPGVGSLANQILVQNSALWPPWTQPADITPPFQNVPPNFDFQGGIVGGMATPRGVPLGTLTAPAT